MRNGESSAAKATAAGSVSFAPVMVEASSAVCGGLLRNSMRDDRDRARRGGGARQSWNRRCDADEGAARGEGRDMIAVPAGVRILVATKPVDFRRGADSLAALARKSFNAIRSPGRSSSFARSGRTG